MKTALLIAAVSIAASMNVALAANAAPATFNKDVLPILEKHCQECHRPGEMAPMSLLGYTEARPWAKAIKAAVVTEKMPPWFADPNYGHFANDRTLTKAEIDTLVSWADNGALEGDQKDAPPPRTFHDGWNIQPDMIIEMPKEFHVAATGTINYQNILVTAHFDQDTWVVAAEMRAGNPKVVHHMRAIVRPPGSTWMSKAIPGEAYEEGSEGMGGAKEGTDLLGKYNPGLGPQNFDVDGAAKFIPKGSDIVFNIHYTSIGTPQTDRSKVGLVFAKNPPQEALLDVAGHARGVQSCDSGRRQQRRGGERSHRRRRTTPSWYTSSRTCTCAARIMSFA